jgi:hypothetical protein
VVAVATVASYHKRLLSIWDKAAKGDVSSAHAKLLKDIKADKKTSLSDIFKDTAINANDGQKLITQIAILGHLKQAQAYNTDRKKYPNIIKAYEKADEHTDAAFKLAKKIGVPQSHRNSAINLERNIYRNVNPMIKAITPQKP